MYFQPQFAITNRMTHAITCIERAQLSADWVREVSERALILEEHKTAMTKAVTA